MASRTQSGHDLNDLNKESRSTAEGNFIMAVIGSRGSGKSSFINLLAEKGIVESSIPGIQTVDFVDDLTRRRVTLVDTPGFDEDNGVTETDVIKKITEFLITQYNTIRNLNGLVYLHSVTSRTRIGGLGASNLKWFLNLSDSNTFNNVVVLTTFWDDHSAWNVGEEREAELKSKLRQLESGGAEFMRHHKTVLSARRVLKHLVLKSELDSLTAKHEAEIAKLEEELKKLRKENGELEARRKRETTDLQKELRHTQNEKTELSKTLASEKKTRQDLETKMQQERDEHKRQEQEWTKKFREQYEAYKAVLNGLHDKFQQMLGDRWIKFERGMAQELLLVPSLVAKSFLGTYSLNMEVRKTY
ncbi:hypothetical protein GYMLUDRAFT_76201 [Collybiopsis luxurians FD-317 M1]|uniref:G domain-containing protein n=1 Tax=Collybiopsis luxurians FD-317 M1 TaxID=944289 RepID=A0A0D0AZT2_9AGAR|nr:hypothetical protein GYMLUDRAFT_76201 [Collybiopsis luxurians FD-317 M1]